ncbi:hypothetical protein [Streptomyces sp. NPDC002402]
MPPTVKPRRGSSATAMGVGLRTVAVLPVVATVAVVIGYRGPGP